MNVGTEHCGGVEQMLSFSTDTTEILKSLVRCCLDGYTVSHIAVQSFVGFQKLI